MKQKLLNIFKLFFIHEENGDGCIMIIDDDYETHYVKCVEISPFSREGTFENNEYYLVVPEVKSIARYAAQFDLSQKLFPEILGVFQKVLLNYPMNRLHETIPDFHNTKKRYK